MMTWIGPHLSYNPSFGRGGSRRPGRRCASRASAKHFLRKEVHSMIQNMPEGVDSKFRLVLLIARRAEQLMRGARPKLDADRPMKPTRMAAEEFEDDRIRWDYGAEGGVLEESEPEEADEEVEEEATV